MDCQRQIAEPSLRYAFCILVLTQVASAVAVPVQNPSFKTIPVGGLSTGCGTGCALENGQVPGWTYNNFDVTSGGEFQPGNRVAARTTYTLRVDLGLSKTETAATALGTLQLLVGGTPVIPAYSYGSAPISGQITVNFAGSDCVLPIAAQAFVVNATVVPNSPLGYLSMWPNGEPQPLVSTLNASDGAATSNMAVVPITSGSIDAFASSATHLILDVSSYFSP